NRYESGGHFRPHKDTEKEAGMFGTLVVQLPTAAGHKGGSLIVRHRRKQHVFAWEDPDGSYARRLGGGAAAAVAGTAAGVPTAAADGVAGGMASTPPSSLPVRCAAFYGDCEHELQIVTSGVRLCLLYNLVRTTPGPQPVGAVGQSGSAAQLRLSDAVAAWGRPGSSCDAAKFIVPLEHEYTRVNMLFGGLKGRDRAMADSLRACRDLDLYLAHVVKHESGTAAPQHPQYGYRGRGSSPGYGCGPRKRRKKCPYDSDYTSADDDSDDGDMFSPDYDDDDDYESDAENQEMDYENDVETDVAAKNWVACNDERIYLDLGIDIESELLGCDDDDDAEHDEEEAMELLFPGNEPDKREYEGYTGNYSPSLEFWYHRAVLVLWPASATMRTALRCGTHAALSAARQRSARYGATNTLPLADLGTIVSLAERKPEEYKFAKEERYAAAVLDLCAGAGAAALDSSRRFLQLLAGGTPGAVENLGFRGDGLSQGVAALVRAVGWQAVGGDVLQIVKASTLEQARYIAGLAWKLSTVPQQQQQQHAAGGGDSNGTSAGALIASTYAGGIASDPPALERVTPYGAAGIVRLFLLRLPCCNGTCYGTDPQLLSFARVGSVRLQTTALAAAVHEFLRGLPTILKNSIAAAGAHSSAVVTLATKLCSRGFQHLGKTEVKTFAEDVLWLAARVDGAGGLEQGFAGAVLTSLRSGDSRQVSKSQGKLKAVLKSETVQTAVRDGGGSGALFWRTLVSERLKKLETIAPPVMTWRQPNAIFHEHPQVQQFLRGPEPKMTYTRSGTFSNKQHARNFARKYFSSNFSEPRHFSARCYEQGRGRSAYVSITKTTEFYDEDVRVYKEDTVEAAVLRGLLGNNKGSRRGRSGGGTAGGENGAAGAAGAAGGNSFAPPPSSVSGNASNGVGTAVAGKRQPEKVEVIDLCSD
ncbi:unnamed protein product, partial [Ectocarpus sp. 6 AP-2014]